MFVSRSHASSIPFPPNVAESVLLSNLRKAIDHGNEHGVWQQLHRNDSNIQPDTDTLHGLLKHAYRKRCSLKIKMLLAIPRQADRQRALQLAVEHDDIHFAEQLLKTGADPYTGHLQPQSHWMHAVLQFPRRQAILYPHAPQPNETKLNQALREGRTDDARTLLHHEFRKYTKGEDVRDVWRDAVRHDRVDLQRALLLLGYVDSEVRYRLKEDDMAAIKDPGVKQVMKEIPYYPPGRGNPEKLNVVAGAKCRHFAVDLLWKMALDAKKAKANYEDFQSQKKIKDNVPTGDEEFIHLKAHATESYLIDNGKFGRFLAQQFEAMEGKGERTKLMLMTSTNHAMTLSLRIKEKDGKTVYVARFFDPNLTTTHARSASTDLQAFAFQNLRDYLDEAELVQVYYPDSEGISMLHVYPRKDELPPMASLPPGAVPNRELDGCIPDKKINATAIWHLMSDGFSANLRRLKDVIAGRPEAQRMTLLAAKDANETPALLMALLGGHADAVEAYGELLSLIPEEQRAELLAAKAANGTTGLLVAIQKGHADAVEAYEKLLGLIPKGQHAEVLAATVMFLGKGDTTAVMYAAASGLAKALQFLIDNGANIDAKSKDGKTALMHAAKKNQIPAIRVLIANGADIDAKDKNGKTAAMRAIANGQTEVLKFLISNGAEVNKILHFLIADGAKIDDSDEYGMSAAMHAAANGHPDILQFLIANGADIHARDREGKTAAMHAAANGHTETLQLLIDHGANIHARSGNRSTALMLAAGSGHLEVIRLLIQKRADIRARNLYFASAVTFARRAQHSAAEEILNEARKKARNG
jgi:ankyrin repeat protein